MTIKKKAGEGNRKAKILWVLNRQKKQIFFCGNPIDSESRLNELNNDYSIDWS